MTLNDGAETPKFLLSDAPAEETQRRYLLSGGGIALLGAVLTVVGAAAAIGAL